MFAAAQSTERQRRQRQQAGNQATKGHLHIEENLWIVDKCIHRTVGRGGGSLGLSFLYLEHFLDWGMRPEVAGRQRSPAKSIWGPTDWFILSVDLWRSSYEDVFFVLKSNFFLYKLPSIWFLLCAKFKRTPLEKVPPLPLAGVMWWPFSAPPQSDFRTGVLNLRHVTALMQLSAVHWQPVDDSGSFAIKLLSDPSWCWLVLVDLYSLFHVFRVKGFYFCCWPLVGF